VAVLVQLAVASEAPPSQARDLSEQVRPTLQVFLVLSDHGRTIAVPADHQGVAPPRRAGDKNGAIERAAKPATANTERMSHKHQCYPAARENAV
jgi:hypothetical protein